VKWAQHDKTKSRLTDHMKMYCQTWNAMQCNDDYGRRREPLCPHQLNKWMCI